ncbi:hypothetical protein GCM10007928_10220 [Sulfitobacter porphyrae]|nr:hypothetical protein GCM10007928_10220 [Sulfitobacter porphyrae]
MYGPTAKSGVISFALGEAGREGIADSAVAKLIACPYGPRNLANLPGRFVKFGTKPKQGKDNL